jgi:hypothetical protein
VRRRAQSERGFNDVESNCIRRLGYSSALRIGCNVVPLPFIHCWPLTAHHLAMTLHLMSDSTSPPSARRPPRIRSTTACHRPQMRTGGLLFNQTSSGCGRRERENSPSATATGGGRRAVHCCRPSVGRQPASRVLAPRSTRSATARRLERRTSKPRRNRLFCPAMSLPHYGVLPSRNKSDGRNYFRRSSRRLRNSSASCVLPKRGTIPVDALVVRGEGACWGER